jgi:hypothetical protein
MAQIPFTLIVLCVTSRAASARLPASVDGAAPSFVTPMPLAVAAAAALQKPLQHVRSSVRVGARRSGASWAALSCEARGGSGGPQMSTADPFCPLSVRRRSTWSHQRCSTAQRRRRLLVPCVGWPLR